MKNSYFDLIDQTYYFPQEGFDLRDGYLTFHGISLRYLIEKYGSPLRLMYLPRIADQIRRARNLFNRSLKKFDFKGRYYYCYCTKCNHFSEVIHKVVNEGTNLETSSSFDIDIIQKLVRNKKITKSTILVHNGYKTKEYLEKIIQLNQSGFKNSITVLDSIEELTKLGQAAAGLNKKIKIGIRMAVNEEPQSHYYTSRLGIRPSEIIQLVENIVNHHPNLDLKMFHFFVDSGIKDSLYYWGEFKKALNLFVEIKRSCPSLRALNIGGGFPLRNHLGFEYDYEYMIDEIIRNIAEICEDEGIEHPDIFTEFGKYTVGESGAIIFSVLDWKLQNDNELWYIIDNSLMNTIPDAWSIFEKFILLPINHWDKDYTKVNIGGISCDHSDYYNSDELNQQVLLPKISNECEEPLYLGFFHTGAYQDSISGYGGIKHCLIPSPKYVIVDRDSKGDYIDRLYRDEQTVDEMLSILGYE